MELVHERVIAITDDSGRAYDGVRIYAEPQAGSTWAGIIEFLPSDGRPALRSARETTQSTPDAVAYWATGLEPIYFEGALARALRQAPVAGDHRIARIQVESIDPQLPLRLLATRTLTRGLRRRVHDAATIVYEGPVRDGGFALLVQYGTDHAAALVADVLWTELGDVASVFVDGVRVPTTPAALKDALVGVTAQRRAG